MTRGALLLDPSTINTQVYEKINNTTLISKCPKVVLLVTLHSTSFAPHGEEDKNRGGAPLLVIINLFKVKPYHFPICILHNSNIATIIMRSHTECSLFHLSLLDCTHWQWNLPNVSSICPCLGSGGTRITAATVTLFLSRRVWCPPAVSQEDHVLPETQACLDEPPDPG